MFLRIYRLETGLRSSRLPIPLHYHKVMSMKLISTLISTVSVWAIGATNGFVPHAQGRVTPEEAHAVRTALDSPKAECIYSYLGDQDFIPFAQEWEPEIFDVPDSCTQSSVSGKPEGYRAMCASSVMCRTPSLSFVVEKAICWSRDGKSCPPPSKCAQQSILRSFQNQKGEAVMPVYITTEPEVGKSRSAK